MTWSLKKDFLRPRLKKSLDGEWITTDVLFSSILGLNVFDLNLRVIYICEV